MKEKKSEHIWKTWQLYKYFYIFFLGTTLVADEREDVQRFLNESKMKIRFEASPSKLNEDILLIGELFSGKASYCVAILKLSL